jgi:hypothetical protein
VGLPGTGRFRCTGLGLGAGGRSPLQQQQQQQQQQQHLGSSAGSAGAGAGAAAQSSALSQLLEEQLCHEKRAASGSAAVGAALAALQDSLGGSSSGQLWARTVSALLAPFCAAARGCQALELAEAFLQEHREAQLQALLSQQAVKGRRA